MLDPRRGDSAGAVAGGNEMINYYSNDQLAADDQERLHLSGGGSQESPAIARLADGGFVAVWVSGNNIIAQLFDSAGTTVGVEQTIAANGRAPAVTALANGGYAIAWTASDDSLDGIWAQTFDLSGVAADPAFAVNSATFGSQQQPTIAALANGEYVVAWTDNGTSGIGNIRAQVFNSDNQPVRNSVTVTSSQFQNSYDPAVAALPNGNFVISWTGPAEDSGAEANAQVFSATGAPVSSVYTSRTHSPGPSFHDGYFSSIDVLSNGQIALAWTDGVGVDVTQVKVQLLSTDGTAVGNPFVVSSGGLGSGQPNITALDNGGFLVTWQEDTPNAGPNYFQRGDIFAQAFSASGTAEGTRFPVATDTFNAQDAPVAVQFGSGDIAFLWRTFPSTGDSDVALRTFYSTTKGTSNDDTLTGTAQVDVLVGYGGNDVLVGLASGDVLDGGEGDDTIAGGEGNDVLIGGIGADRLTGGMGADTLTGGEGADTFLDTGAGLDGDTITHFTKHDRIVINDANLANFTFSRAGNTLSYSGGSVTFGSVPAGQLVAHAAAEGGVELTLQSSGVVDDYNGDGRSDVLWRHETGSLTNWRLYRLQTR